jgi:hypothetical protein
MNAAPPPAAVGPPPPADPNAPVMIPLDEVAMKYRQLRDKRDEIKARHDTELAPYKDAMKSLEVVLINHFNRTGMESVRTLGGTIYKSVRRSAKVVDAASLRAWAEAEGRTDIFQARVNNEVLDSIVEAGGSLPPGVEISSMITINIKK